MLCLCSVSVAVAYPSYLTTVPSHVGSNMCPRGPSFWCQNITNAKSCSAVKHCIQTVWEHQVLPPDNGSVCQICKDMVKQARDQLESNETQEELKQVFEGSCRLIPLKVVSTECVKLADEFIPELVETLASQMNPQVVCSVAGLCNSARIDNMLQNGEEDSSSGSVVIPAVELIRDDCVGCNQIAKHMEEKFRSTPRDDILNNMLEACGRLGSLSDGCAAIVITHFNSLYNHLVRNLESDGLCHLAGVCQYKFHSHSTRNIEVIHESTVGKVRPGKEDLPCELCEQLVVHLRDILVANTTEQEFEQVLKGVCKQFSTFKDQCLSIVDEYYTVIYDFLVNSLRPTDICSMVGICPRPSLNQAPIWPLLPVETIEQFHATVQQEHSQDDVIPAIRLNIPVIGKDEANSYNVLHRVPIGGKGVGVRVVEQMEVQPALPIERMMPLTINYSHNKEVCALCEYMLHYLQIALTAPSTESKIKEVVEQACDHLPDTINAQCRSFVDTYGDALVALLAQEIDPSQVCPKLGLCASEQVMLDLTHSVSDKPTCPLCLFAVEELITTLKNNRTEDRIRQALNHLCSDLPNSLQGECRNFVENYEEELVDMLIADFTPQEVCAYLKLCDAPTHVLDEEIISNEIPQVPATRRVVTAVGTQQGVRESTSCVLCEFVMSKIDSALKNKATEDEIKQVVHGICNHMPRTVVKECNEFVDQYAELVITLLAQSLDPKQVCSEINLCHEKTRLQATASLEECAVCDATLGALDQLLANPIIEGDAARAIQKVCRMLPPHNIDQCKSIVKIYGPSVLNLIARHTDTHIICEKIGLCPRNRQVVNLVGGKKCTWGPGYWCQTEEHARACGTTVHCQEKVWLAERPGAK